MEAYKLRQVETELLEQEKNIHQEVSSLKDLVRNDQRMYEAMQNFLLLEPERQMPQLGEVDSFLAAGHAAREAGDTLKARVNYEIAARIEIYKQNKDSALKCIELAKAVTDELDKHKEYHETILANMDEVLRIAKAYYGNAVITQRRPTF